MSVNPIFKMLFIGMTMKAWLNYSVKVSKKIKAAQAIGTQYVPSESDEEDYTENDSEEENSSSSENENSVEEEEEKQGEDNKMEKEKDEGVEEEEKENTRFTSSKIESERKRLGFKKNPFGSYQFSQVGSPKSFLIKQHSSPKLPIRLESSRLGEGQPDINWGVSPLKLSSFQRSKVSQDPESSKAIFNFWDGEKMSATSKEESFKDESIQISAGEGLGRKLNPSKSSIMKPPEFNSQFLAPPLRKEFSVPSIKSLRNKNRNVEGSIIKSEKFD